MNKFFQVLLSVTIIAVLTTGAFAGGSSPGLYYGQVPTAAQWNSYFASKLDYVPGVINTIPYWNVSGDLTNAVISGDCTAIANSFTCNKNAGVILRSSTVPTIYSGFGSSASIVSNNGTSTFNINIGSGGVAASGVVAMPTASTGWNCIVTPASAPQAAAVAYSTSTSTTKITIENYNITTGAALAWVASTVIAVNCNAY